MLLLIRLYQKTPLEAHSACRFTPHCSEYTYQAIRGYGIVKGTVLGFKRILHCHPGHPGGFDPLPKI